MNKVFRAGSRAAYDKRYYRQHRKRILKQHKRAYRESLKAHVGVQRRTRGAAPFTPLPEVK